MLNRISLACFFLFSLFAQIVGQAQTPSSQTSRPVLNAAPLRELIEEPIVQKDGTTLVFQSGKGIPLALSDASVLRLSLNGSLGSEGMSGQTIERLCILKDPVFSQFGQVLTPDKFYVETYITGIKAGMIKQAQLKIEPKTIYVEIGPDDYVIADVRGEQTVYLKQGRWRFDIRASLRSIDNGDKSYYPRSPRDESTWVKAGKFGGNNGGFRDAGPSGFDQIETGLMYVRGGGIAYSIINLAKGGVQLLFQRPNWRLPPTAELHFHIDRLTATFLGPSVPKNK